jgi:hypothetical protein
MYKEVLGQSTDLTVDEQKRLAALNS